MLKPVTKSTASTSSPPPCACQDPHTPEQQNIATKNDRREKEQSRTKQSTGLSSVITRKYSTSLSLERERNHCYLPKLSYIIWVTLSLKPFFAFHGIKLLSQKEPEQSKLNLEKTEFWSVLTRTITKPLIHLAQLKI